MTGSTRDRLVTAAFELFEERGYDATTVEEIAASAGLSRSTFFRHFPAKEDVVFPDHESLLRAVDARLALGDLETAVPAMADAARVVFRHYVSEPAMARSRYELTRAVPSLRASEIAHQRLYRQVFATHFRDWFAGSHLKRPDLIAGVLAGAVVTAHNYVLRQWLRGDLQDLEAEVQLNDAVRDLASQLLAESPDGHSEVLIVRSRRDLEQVVPELRRLLAT